MSAASDGLGAKASCAAKPGLASARLRAAGRLIRHLCPWVCVGCHHSSNARTNAVGCGLGGQYFASRAGAKYPSRWQHLTSPGKTANQCASLLVDGRRTPNNLLAAMKEGAPKLN